MLYWGSIIGALGNGTIEAVINPVVATMFPRQKTKWLAILHPGFGPRRTGHRGTSVHGRRHQGC
ncbi:MAG: hypothetical protein CM1200mP2_29000 [Planctomycetaceae bacterium]|nr:MAG: hypothetical protein CM1200mP2_29000 [Planctomycetaceae bacterium]